MSRACGSTALRSSEGSQAFTGRGFFSVGPVVSWSFHVHICSSSPRAATCSATAAAATCEREKIHGRKNNVGPRSEHSLQVSCRSPLAIDVVWLSSSSRKIERGTRRWTRGCVGPSGKARSYLRPIKIPFFISDSSLMCDVPSFAENVHVRRESSLGKASICMPLRC